MSESDEIDIEEHDILDNPAIKLIFPDLSVIKKEINQFYDDVFNPSKTPSPADLCEDAVTTESEATLPNHSGNSPGLLKSFPTHISNNTAPLVNLYEEVADTTESAAQVSNTIRNSQELLNSSTFNTPNNTVPLVDLCDEEDADTTETETQDSEHFQKSKGHVISGFNMSNNTAALVDLCGEEDADTTESAAQLSDHFQNSKRRENFSTFNISNNTAPVVDLCCEEDADTTETEAQLSDRFQNSKRRENFSTFNINKKTALEDVCEADADTAESEAQLSDHFQNSKGRENFSTFNISNNTAPVVDLCGEEDADTTETEAQLSDRFQNGKGCENFSTFNITKKTVRLEDVCEANANTTESDAQLSDHIQNSKGRENFSTFNISKNTKPLEDVCEADAVTTESESQVSNHSRNSQELVESIPIYISKNTAALEDFCEEDADTMESDVHLAEHFNDPNVIILGSKPRRQNSLRKEPEVLLEDINIFLNSCKRYCKECLILFPKADLLNIHMVNKHFKRNDQLACMRSKVTGRLFKCIVCDKLLANLCSLLRHYKNLHGDATKLKIAAESSEIGANDDTEAGPSAGLSCFHCPQLFFTRSSLILHQYEILNLDKIRHSDRFKSSAGADKQIKEQRNDQLQENGFVEALDKSNNNEIVENNHASSSGQMDIDDCDEDEVKLTKCGDKNIKNIKRKANSDPSKDEHGNSRKKLKTNECKDQFNSKKVLRYPIRSRTTEKSNNNNKSTSETGIEITETPSPPLLYKCFICSRYYVTLEYFTRHIMNDHKLKKVPEVIKMPFESKCKFCSSPTSGMNSYNAHLLKCHKAIVKGAYFPCEELQDNKPHEQSDQNIELAFKSILFKCKTCDLYFLSASRAMDHSKHLGITDTWTCPDCQRMFTTESMALHEKQHSFSQSFTVHSLDEAAFSQILYNCSICAVYFTEEYFLLHYPKCGPVTPDSLYCQICDILMNRDDMPCHKINHEEKNMQPCDFVIIESDMMDDRHTTKHERASKTTKYFIKRFELKTNDDNLKDSKFAMSFCPTCKCFLYNVSMRNFHKQGKCEHIVKYACKECGLIFTKTTHERHKQSHKKQQIGLHDFIFYDLKTEKRIVPPIPDYPECEHCGVQFLRISELRSHSCTEQFFITCDVCATKLTVQAHKLHIEFHSYSITNGSIKLNETTLPADPASASSSVEPRLSDAADSYTTNVMFSYSCKSCPLSVNTYDKVVQHCQDHYESKIELDIMRKCEYCTLTLLLSDYENHSKLHLNETFNIDSIKVVDFDPFYFRYDNEFWTNHIFAYIADEDISQILHNSIYRYECRLKMEKIQSGWSNSVLYRCDKCQVFVDPPSLFKHANVGGQSCAKLRNHPCSLCGLNFVSSTYRTAHEQEHAHTNFNLKSYKIVLYNKKEHDTYNEVIFNANFRYVFYQCRNCERALTKIERSAHICDENNLKMCSFCGLIIDKQDFETHAMRHEELGTFNDEHMTIVLFGKLCNHGKNKLRSTFTGTTHDYTMYQCNNCEVCVTTRECMSEHICVRDDSKCKCSKCGRYFSHVDLKCHYEAHENNLEFDELNVNVITFDPSSAMQTQTEQANQNASIKPKTVYKCNNCQLHFFDPAEAQRHTNSCSVGMKISKMNCMKCKLTLTPADLFLHLMRDHHDKKLPFRYDIVLVSKKRRGN